MCGRGVRTRFAIESAPICSSFAFSPVDSSSTVAEPGVQSRRSAATRRPSNMVVAQDKVLALGSKWLLRKTRPRASSHPRTLYVFTRRRGANTAHTQMGRRTHEAPTREYTRMLYVGRLHHGNETR